MSSVHAIDRPEAVQEYLAKARRAANIGDSSHTILHAQEAVCLALGTLGDEIAALRRELAGRTVRS
jgi:hypothetical protein